MKTLAIIFGLMSVSFFILGCSKEAPQTVTPEPSTINVETPSLVVESDARDDAARFLVLDFFDKLSMQRYDDALALFSQNSEDLKMMKDFMSEGDKANNVNVLKNFCENVTGTCFRAVAEDLKKISDDEFVVTVQFLKEDGSLFIQGPSSGATEAEMHSKESFDIKVIREDGKLKVATAPIYTP